MKKNLLALTLFFFATSILADTVFYDGKVPDPSDGNTIARAPRGEDPLGFKSSENAGNGLKAIWQLEGHYQPTDQLRLAFGYQVTTDRSEPGRSDSTGLKTRDYIFSAAYRIGLFTPKFSYAQGSEENGLWMMGVDYAFSQRTQATLSYGSLQFGNGVNDPNGEFFGGNGARRESTLGLQLRHRF
jgi:predicted porin